MIILKRCICYALLFLALNPVLIIYGVPYTALAVVGCIALAVYYIFFNVSPAMTKIQQQRLRILRGGYELMLAAILCFVLEVAAYVFLLLQDFEIPAYILIINAVVCLLLLAVLALNGVIRIFACSKQLGLLPRILLLCLWWMPVVNILILRYFIRASNKEYTFTLKKQERNARRKDEALCKTKYPLLLVHGIFFRDWKNFNYWGRIPKELTDNGAVIYYGSHHSSASVEQCAAELKESLAKILAETGCEKVNIIAHSKGGLDARYMISCLGMGAHVASLTTIGTPHLGCNYVGKILEKIPQKTVATVGEKYEALYTKLGDENPDFFSGLSNLTDKECARLNKNMPDAPGVLYQSIGSRVRSYNGAMFPMNIGYGVIKLDGGGDNDGLVATSSMMWGDFLGVLSPKGKKGISHADMIDLTRKDIEGFDVCELYVDLVSGLKTKGL